METTYNISAKEQNISNMLKVLFFIVIISFIIRDGLGINIPTSLFLFLYLFGFMLLKGNEMLLYFIFLVPLSTGPLLYYLHVVFGLMFLIKNINVIKINRTIIISFILVLWETLHLLPNAILGYSESIIKLLGFSLCLFVTVICISSRNLKINYVTLMFSWCLGLASFCGILLLKYIYKFGIGNLSLAVRRFGWVPNTLDVVSTSLLINPNALGKLVVLTVFCLLTVVRFEKKYIKLITFSIIYFILFGIMTVSRGFLLNFLVLSIVFILEMLCNISQNKKLLFITIIVIILIFTIVIKFMESTLNMFSERLQSEDISGSRFKIFSMYLNYLKCSPYLILGSGMQDYTDKFNMEASSHNIIIEVISIWGIVGLAIVVLWFISLYKSLNVNKKVFNKSRTVLPYLPLVGLMLSAQAGQFFISYYDTFPTLILAFLCIKYGERKIIENNTI